MSITVNWPLGATMVPSTPDCGWLVGVAGVRDVAGLERAERGGCVVGLVAESFLLAGFAFAGFPAPVFLLVALARVDFAPVFVEAAM